MRLAHCMANAQGIVKDEHGRPTDWITVRCDPTQVAQLQPHSDESHPRLYNYHPLDVEQ